MLQKRPAKRGRAAEGELAEETKLKEPAKSSTASGHSVLTIQKMNAEELCSVHVREGCTVADLKKAAAAELTIPWWQQHWTSVKEGGTILTNDCVMDVRQIPEVTCIAVPKPCFPLDQGKFNLLVVTGMSAKKAVFGIPDENGRLVVAGEVGGPGGDEIDDAAMLEDRLLTIKGDPTPEAEDPGDSYTSAAWSKEVKLDPGNAPILLGWRVHIKSDVQPDQCFGLTTSQHMTTNAGPKEPTAVLGFLLSPQTTKSKVVCSQTSLTVGSEPTTKKLDYDVLVVFDPLKKEVRASVGCGGSGLHADKVVVPSELWPSSDLPLVPFVWLEHIGGDMTMDMTEEELPITIEALTSQQMAEEAVSALMGS